jgi:hypothetical protein
MNESKGIPASLDAHCEMTIGVDLEDRLAASTSTKVARHQMKRECVLKNMYGRGLIWQLIDHVPKPLLHRLPRVLTRDLHIDAEDV